jgi:glutaredoxin
MKFLKKYKDLIFLYLLYATALAFIFSQNGCANSSKYRTLIKDGKIYVTVKVTVYSTSDCYYCDVAKKFLKTNQIKYVEKDFNKSKDQQELFTIADKIGFDKRKLDGVPIFVIETKDKTTIIVGYSREELLWLIKKQATYQKVYNRYMDTIRIRK